MRGVVVLSTLALVGCSSLVGSGTTSQQSAGRTTNVSERPAPVQSGIESSPHSVADISAVQQKLANSGFYNGPVDGQWGPKSAAAIRDYQRTNGLNVTGEADDATRIQMNLLPSN